MLHLSRRAAVLALIAAARQAAAQDRSVDPIRPYIEVKPVPGDATVVRVFFSPNCSFSMQYFRFFMNLKATLPKNREFQFSAVVNRGDGEAYALAFAAVQLYEPRYLDNFVQASLEGAQQHGLHTNTWAGVDQIAKAAHIPDSVPRIVAQHRRDVQQAVAEAIVRQRDLKITNTPSVSVSGTYIATPEFANGDPHLFSQLVNGLISMSI